MPWGCQGNAVNASLAENSRTRLPARHLGCNRSSHCGRYVARSIFSLDLEKQLARCGCCSFCSFALVALKAQSTLALVSAVAVPVALIWQHHASYGSQAGSINTAHLSAWASPPDLGEMTPLSVSEDIWSAAEAGESRCGRPQCHARNWGCRIATPLVWWWYILPVLAIPGSAAGFTKPNRDHDWRHDSLLHLNALHFTPVAASWLHRPGWKETRIAEPAACKRPQRWLDGCATCTAKAWNAASAPRLG